MLLLKLEDLRWNKSHLKCQQSAKKQLFCHRTWNIILGNKWTDFETNNIPRFVQKLKVWEEIGLHNAISSRKRSLTKWNICNKWHCELSLKIVHSSDIFRHKSDAGFTKTINFADITWQDKSNVSWDSSRESMSVKDVLRVIGSVWV